MREIEAAFSSRYGTGPAGVVWAPGRVNIIGEHTDYSDLPVLPMAIDRGLKVAYAPAADRVAASSSAFPETADWSLDQIQTLDVSTLSGWPRYLLGVLRVLGTLDSGGLLHVAADLPSVGGLSSSSALTLGLLKAVDLASESAPRPSVELVELAIEAERVVGVESGGMDQNAIALAEAGKALRIDFAPTRTRLVPLPQTWSWIAASSGVEAPKGGRVRDHYNARVLGTRLAAALLGKRLGRDPRQRLAAFHDPDGRAACAELPAEASARRVARETDVPSGFLLASSAGGLVDPGPVSVRAVALHVLDEASRVDAAERALAAGALDPVGALDSVGALLDASHASLQDFGASTPELDSLCTAMSSAGAVGARLTGAGFGGFAIAVAPRERADAVVAAAERACGGPAFVVEPSSGLRKL